MKLFHLLKDIKAGSIVILEPATPVVCRVVSISEKVVLNVLEVFTDRCYVPAVNGTGDEVILGGASYTFPLTHRALLIREPS